MRIRIDKAGPVPIHDKIKDQVLGLVHAGKLTSGDKLPTMRALSIALAVNFNTVAHAYRELDAEGVIATRRGEGTLTKDTVPADVDAVLFWVAWDAQKAALEVED